MNDPTLMVVMSLGRLNAPLCAVAKDLARRTGASLAGIARANPLEALVMPAGVAAGEIVKAEIDQMEREAAAAKAEFPGTRWDMALTPHPLSGEIAKAACAADIVLAALAEDGEDFTDGARRADLGELVMQAGRPVLLVPPGVGHFGFGRALVAWKDCREARHALAAALPLLRLMSWVVLVEITDEAGPEEAEARLAPVTDWLSRQGIPATPRLVPSGGGDGERLLELAEEEGAELIVAGAYGHARAREWVLGGVTRTLLRRARRCLLLAH